MDTLTRIGSQMVASEYQEVYANYYSDELGTGTIPKPWKFLGDNMRLVLLGSDNVVYKASDYDEYERIINAPQVPGWYVPKVSYYEDISVLAMEYIDGVLIKDKFGIDFNDDDYFLENGPVAESYYNRNMVEKLYCLTDIHVANVIEMPNGLFACIDWEM